VAAEALKAVEAVSILPTMTVDTNLITEQDVEMTTEGVEEMIVTNMIDGIGIVTGTAMTDEEDTTLTETIGIVEVTDGTAMIGRGTTDEAIAGTEIDIGIVEEEETPTTTEEGEAAEVEEIGMAIGRSKRATCLLHMPFLSFKRKAHVM